MSDLRRGEVSLFRATPDPPDRTAHSGPRSGNEGHMAGHNRGVRHNWHCSLLGLCGRCAVVPSIFVGLCGQGRLKTCLGTHRTSIAETSTEHRPVRSGGMSINLQRASQNFRTVWDSIFEK